MRGAENRGAEEIVSSFSIDWLNLREEADLRARDPALLSRARRWLEVAGAEGAEAAANVVVDLGAGTGATLRALAAIGGSHPVPAVWRLLDHDKSLLAEANRRHGSSQQLEIYPVDLANVATLPLNGVRLVTASALFDLVSAEFIEALTAALLRASGNNQVGIYSALNYDGTTDWEPAHPLDKTVLAAFNRDQRQDKGFGPALGPDAGRCMAEIFSKAGFVVHTAESPWQLGATDKALVNNLIEGISEAVANDATLDPTELTDWTRFRQSHVATGSCKVGHADILAISRPR
ncbi:MAG: class I SAM-dependent methyltransferase [Gammaproteobacteria bacterium]|nr:class I SAM-dependent methyltransferase [Gammaproteobacteria bacterium]